MESYQMNATQIDLPLSGRWLLIVRLAWWVLTISVLIIFALAIPGVIASCWQRRQRHRYLRPGNPNLSFLLTRATSLCSCPLAPRKR